MSKMSAHTSSTMFCRRYPQVTTSASRKVSSRGRPSPLSHGSSSSSATQHSSSPSCSSSSPDIRSYRNGFSVVERFGLETSFLSAGEAVACYPLRRGARFFNMSGKSSPYCTRYGVCIILTASRDLDQHSGRSRGRSPHGSSKLVMRGRFPSPAPPRPPSSASSRSSLSL